MLTAQQKRALKVGAYVASPHDSVPYAPRRVTAIWWNGDHSLLRISTGSKYGPWWWSEDLVLAPGPGHQWQFNLRTGSWDRVGAPSSRTRSSRV